MKSNSKAGVITVFGSLGFVFMLLALMGLALHEQSQNGMAQGEASEPQVGISIDPPPPTFPIFSEISSAQMLAGSNGTILLPDKSQLACAAPLVLSGSIITGTNPLHTGRLIRNGSPSICGKDYSCSGVQNTSTRFAYETFNFLNPSADWQCVQVDINASACAQQVYSAAYLNSFDPNNLCSNIQGAMGFSTSEKYGYSFLASPNTGFKIVNNTTGSVPPSSNCANYTMTVSLCSATPKINVTKGVGLGEILADSSGKAVVQVPVIFKNLGNYPGSVSAQTVSETVDISVKDGKPAAVQASFGQAGAIVLPGQTVTQMVPLKFSGSQFQCLPRFYTVNSQLTMISNIYHCNGYNPPSAEVVAGSILPSDPFVEDRYAFQSLAGDRITVTVDTVSAATAFDIEACLSDTPSGGCLPGFQGNDDFNCTFAPPGGMCPRFGGVLPADADGDNTYYLRVNSGSGASNFAGPSGNYQATLLVTSGPTGICPAVAALDNAAKSFLQLANPLQPFAALPPTSTITAAVAPIRIRVPAAAPGSPGCGLAYLPSVFK